MSTVPRLVLFAALALAAVSCGRVLKRGSAREAAEPEAIAMLLPEGALCASNTVDVDAWSAGAGESCAKAMQGGESAWSDAEPPGVCYEPSGRCRGLPDGVAYLTFDDGPSDWTATILDTLAEQHVHATFFVNAYGEGAKGRLQQSYRDDAGNSVHYRDVLARILSEGHALGNHTRDHADLGMLTRDEVIEQYAQNELLVNIALYRAGATPRPLTLLRPPFGSPWRSHGDLADPEHQERVVGREAVRFGYNVLWNIDSSDSREWAPGEASTREQLRKMKQTQAAPEFAAKVERVRDTVLEDELVRAGAGVVVLMHDTHNTTRDALPEIIAGLQQRGYRFQTLEEQVAVLFGRSSLALTPGPALFRACSGPVGGPERARSCLQPNAAEPAVCGRFWLAYEELGGEAELGRALSEPEQHAVLSQRFEHGTIELHPEWPAPCDVVFVPDEVSDGT